MAGILRGEIVWADLNPARGSEQAGIRPVLVLSEDKFNQNSGTVIAVALTSRPPRIGFPFTLELSSTSHRFEELTALNWASYLINTRTLELSFLDRASARELLTAPVPKLHYEDGVVDEILRLTHCQPYLLQAVASELVNHLNDRQKTTATHEDRPRQWNER